MCISFCRFSSVLFLLFFYLLNKLKLKSENLPLTYIVKMLSIQNLTSNDNATAIFAYTTICHFILKMVSRYRVQSLIQTDRKHDSNDVIMVTVAISFYYHFYFSALRVQIFLVLFLWCFNKSKSSQICWLFGTLVVYTIINLRGKV